MPEEMKTNALGHLVPVSKIKTEDKLEDMLVTELFDDADHLSKQLASFKRNSFGMVEQFLDTLTKQYGGKKGGKKGNLSLTSFDGLTRVQVSVADFIQFGPQLQVAKGLIDECIRDWNKKGSNENIVALVNHAFRVDKEGQVNKANILGLRKVEIKGAKWQKAMEAIADSVKVTATKQYIRFMRRENPDAPWKSVLLDIASV